MLGIVSDEQFENELLNCESIISQANAAAQYDAQIKQLQIGRGHVTEVPKIIREIIAEDAILSDLTGQELAVKYNVSPSSIAAYKHGATSTATYHQPDLTLSKKTDEIRENIITSAKSKLLAALQHITPDKLADTKVRDLAGIAKDMSAVVKNIEPEIINGDKPAVQFVFYAPQVVSETKYEVIEVKD